MGKRQSLTREFIAAHAIALADRSGINTLSMRNLAAGMNIQAMSLYHHFKTKDELLSFMADTLLGSVELPEEDTSGLDWRQLLSARAIAAKELFSSHLWLPQVIDFQIHSGARRLQYLNNYIGTLRKAGLPIAVALRAISLIDSYIYGYCRQLAHASDSSLSAQEQAEQFAAGFDAAQYPYLSEATALVMQAGYDADAEFLAGLELILNGVDIELKGLQERVDEQGLL